MTCNPKKKEGRGKVFYRNVATQQPRNIQTSLGKQNPIGYRIQTTTKSNQKTQNATSEVSLLEQIKKEYPDHEVTENNEGYLVTAKPVKYTAEWKKNQPNEKNKYSYYIPHEVIIDKQGNLVRETSYATHKVDATKTTYTREPYITNTKDYKTGEQKSYRTVEMNYGRKKIVDEGMPITDKNIRELRKQQAQKVAEMAYEQQQKKYLQQLYNRNFGEKYDKQFKEYANKLREYQQAKQTIKKEEKENKNNELKGAYRHPTGYKKNEKGYELYFYPEQWKEEEIKEKEDNYKFIGKPAEETSIKIGGNEYDILQRPISMDENNYNNQYSSKFNMDTWTDNINSNANSNKPILEVMQRNETGIPKYLEEYRKSKIGKYLSGKYEELGFPQSIGKGMTKLTTYNKEEPITWIYKPAETIMTEKQKMIDLMQNKTYNPKTGTGNWTKTQAIETPTEVITQYALFSNPLTASYTGSYYGLSLAGQFLESPTTFIGDTAEYLKEHTGQFIGGIKGAKKGTKLKERTYPRETPLAKELGSRPDDFPKIKEIMDIVVDKETGEISHRTRNMLTPEEHTRIMKNLEEAIASEKAMRRGRIKDTVRTGAKLWKDKKLGEFILQKLKESKDTALKGSGAILSRESWKKNTIKNFQEAQDADIQELRMRGLANKEIIELGKKISDELKQKLLARAELQKILGESIKVKNVGEIKRIRKELKNNYVNIEELMNFSKQQMQNLRLATELGQGLKGGIGKEVRYQMLNKKAELTPEEITEKDIDVNIKHPYRKTKLAKALIEKYPEEHEVISREIKSPKRGYAETEEYSLGKFKEERRNPKTGKIEEVITEYVQDGIGVWSKKYNPETGKWEKIPKLIFKGDGTKANFKVIRLLDKKLEEMEKTSTTKTPDKYRLDFGISPFLKRLQEKLMYKNERFGVKFKDDKGKTHKLKLVNIVKDINDAVDRAKGNREKWYKGVKDILDKVEKGTVKDKFKVINFLENKARERARKWNKELLQDRNTIMKQEGVRQVISEAKMNEKGEITPETKLIEVIEKEGFKAPIGKGYVKDQEGRKIEARLPAMSGKGQATIMRGRDITDIENKDLQQLYGIRKGVQKELNTAKKKSKINKWRINPLEKMKTELAMKSEGRLFDPQLAEGGETRIVGLVRDITQPIKRLIPFSKEGLEYKRGKGKEIKLDTNKEVQKTREIKKQIENMLEAKGLTQNEISTTMKKIKERINKKEINKKISTKRAEKIANEEYSKIKEKINKRRGKIPLILLIGLLIIGYAVSELDTGDIDALPLCNLTNSIPYRNSTHWTCITYASFNNLTMTSNNGTIFNCAINNTGSWECN